MTDLRPEHFAAFGVLFAVMMIVTSPVFTLTVADIGSSWGSAGECERPDPPRVVDSRIVPEDGGYIPMVEVELEGNTTRWTALEKQDTREEAKYAIVGYATKLEESADLIEYRDPLRLDGCEG